MNKRIKGDVELLKMFGSIREEERCINTLGARQVDIGV
jgi:hypothetical protein